MSTETDERVPGEEEAAAAEVAVPCEDIGGVAGTGKTTLIKKRILDDPTWGMLCATTGIAAVNLDAITLNSALRYFDTASLRDSYLRGTLITRLHEISVSHRNLVIDEKSMLDADQLSIIHRATTSANEYANARPLGLVLVGDFAQLPPVNARWCFESDVWPEFEAHSTKLTKVWRQDQLEFLAALNAARVGNGALAAEILTSVGVQWHTAVDTEFEGTTIVPENKQVDRHNNMALDHHSGKPFSVTSRRWGIQSNDSKWKNIPDRSEFKLGAYVMILSNAPRRGDETEFEYVNGDCGFVEDFSPVGFTIRLVRNDSTIFLPRLVRDVALADRPPHWLGTDGERTDEYRPLDHRNKKGRYVTGQCEYFPLRLAWCSTVHKSQSLSLDRVQIDFRNSFMAHPGMLYTALSRCRTLQGLRLVGQKERFIKNCNTDSRIARWL